MSDLAKIKSWISTYPGIENLQKFWVDYYTPDPDNGSINPSGLVEVSRTTNLMGDTIVENQYHFGLYFALTNTSADDTDSTTNADWILGLQRWVQEQSIKKLAPTFGDEPETELIKAQNGVLYATDTEGTATYMVQLSIHFKNIYEVN